jgi:hypothetical protein
MASYDEQERRVNGSIPHRRLAVCEYAKSLKRQERFGGERDSRSDGYGVTLLGRGVGGRR